MSDDALESEIPEVKVRALLIDEDEAINGYLEVKGTDPELDKIIDDIILEENEHKGQLQAWLDKRNPKSATAMAEGLREGEEQMTKEKAWSDFKKSFMKNHYPNQISVSDKLDSIEAKLMDMQTSVERLDEVVPELAGDMVAIENEEANMEELGMPKEVDGLLYSDVTEEASGMEGQDTNEASTEGGVDTKPSEVAEVGEDLDIGSGKAPEKDEVGGEDVDDSTEQLEGEVGDVDTEIKVSKANFDKLVSMIKSQKVRVDEQDKTIRLLKAQVANLRVVNTDVTPINKEAPKGEKVIQRARPPVGIPATNEGITKADMSAGKVVVNTKPPMHAGYRSGGTPEEIRKSLETPTEPMKIGMGTNSNDVASGLARRIDALASARRNGL